MKSFLLYASFAFGLAIASNDVCNNFLQIHKHCVPGSSGSQGRAGKRGVPGPVGPVGERGPAGIVDYNIINETLDGKFQEMESRMTQKLETCSQNMELLKQKLKRLILTDCSLVSMYDKNTGTAADGTYEIYIGSNKKEVYCDMTKDNGGWIVFQRRMDGSENFLRGWNDYVNGFGNIQKEFWIGLENLHKITSVEKFEMRVELEDWDGNRRYAKYSNFKIGNVGTKYQLTIGGYSGNAGDSLAEHNGRKFSTKDRDNDLYPGSCAQRFKGAWWYRSCHNSNLNGFYYKGGTHSSYADGVEWAHWKGHQYSMKFVEMKIRPSK